MARASEWQYQPDDRLLFEGGQTFTGSLWLRSNSQGTPEQPIVITSFGSGQVTIASGTTSGFYAYNSAGIELRRLTFKGDGRLNSTSPGVSFYLDSVDTKLRYLRLDSLDVSGYRGAGLVLGIWGYCCNNLVIQHCESHHNHSGTAHDGGGFDLDGGCTNSVLQYNYSHDNDGPGYLLAQYPGAASVHDLTIRYNVRAPSRLLPLS